MTPLTLMPTTNVQGMAESNLGATRTLKAASVSVVLIISQKILVFGDSSADESHPENNKE